MGKVFPGMPLSAQRYQIGIPQAKHDAAREIPQSASLVPAFDLDAVVRASHRIVDESSNDARALINDARERAKAIVSKALEMAAELETKGYEDGLRRAEEERESQIQNAVREAREGLFALVDHVRAERRQFFLNAEHDMAQLSVEIAKKILQREVETTPEATLPVVRAALKRLSERDQVTIRVSPGDLDCIREHRDAFLHETDIGDLRIIADPRVDRGGVVIETDSGSIDGRIDAQLLVAKEALLQLNDPNVQDDVG